MANITPWLTMASTALQASGQLQQADATGAAAEFEAMQLEENADATMAQTGVDVRERLREGRILESDARAAMAASGGTTTDAGAIETLSGIKETSARNALQTLYSGSRRATGQRRQAAASRFRGETAQRAGRTKALSTALMGGLEGWEMFKASEKPKLKKIPSTTTYSI